MKNFFFSILMIISFLKQKTFAKAPGDCDLELVNYVSLERTYGDEGRSSNDGAPKSYETYRFQKILESKGYVVKILSPKNYSGDVNNVKIETPFRLVLEYSNWRGENILVSAQLKIPIVASKSNFASGADLYDDEWFFGGTSEYYLNSVFKEMEKEFPTCEIAKQLKKKSTDIVNNFHPILHEASLPVDKCMVNVTSYLINALKTTDIYSLAVSKNYKLVASVNSTQYFDNSYTQSESVFYNNTGTPFDFNSLFEKERPYSLTRKSSPYSPEIPEMQGRIRFLSSPNIVEDFGRVIDEYISDVDYKMSASPLAGFSLKQIGDKKYQIYGDVVGRYRLMRKFPQPSVDFVASVEYRPVSRVFSVDEFLEFLRKFFINAPTCKR